MIQKSKLPMINYTLMYFAIRVNQNLRINFGCRSFFEKILNSSNSKITGSITTPRRVRATCPLPRNPKVEDLYFSEYKQLKFLSKISLSDNYTLLTSDM